MREACKNKMEPCMVRKKERHYRKDAGELADRRFRTDRRYRTGVLTTGNTQFGRVSFVLQRVAPGHLCTDLKQRNTRFVAVLL